MHTRIGKYPLAKIIKYIFFLNVPPLDYFCKRCLHAMAYLAYTLIRHCPSARDFFFFAGNRCTVGEIFVVTCKDVGKYRARRDVYYSVNIREIDSEWKNRRYRHV